MRGFYLMARVLIGVAVFLVLVHWIVEALS